MSFAQAFQQVQDGDVNLAIKWCIDYKLIK
jgi:hypothetical protein